MTGKKNFKNPAEQFISTAQEAPQMAAVYEAPAGYRLTRESKSRRLQLLIRQYTYDGLKQSAAEQGISLNELANRIFEAYLKGVE